MKTNSFLSFFSFFSKRGFGNFEKVIVGIILLILLLVMSPLLLGSTFLENSEVLSGFPLWLVPLILLAVGLGVASLIRS